MTAYVNLYGGPGVGKSTAAAGVFYELKTRGVNCELVPEFAKDLTWEGRADTLRNQYYVTARQFQMIKKLDTKADVVITDSPVILGIPYAVGYPRMYEEMLVWFGKQVSTDGLNFVLSRDKPFCTLGRIHTEGESINIDEHIRLILLQHDIPFERVGGKGSVKTIVERVMRQIS